MLIFFSLLFFQALLGLSAKANVGALKDRILTACLTGESNGTTSRNDYAMDTEDVVVRESQEPGSITVSVPRFKLRLTVSTPQEFYILMIYFASCTPEQYTVNSHIFLCPIYQSI